MGTAAGQRKAACQETGPDDVRPVIFPVRHTYQHDWVQDDPALRVIGIVDETAPEEA